jgi:gamma-tubulin complex component 3
MADILYTELDTPAPLVYRHNLLATLQRAVQASNARFEDADILNRLSVRVLQPSADDCGWDVFSLDYLVDSPINVGKWPRITQLILSFLLPL